MTPPSVPKKYMNFFNISLVGPPPKSPILVCLKEFICLISWERRQKRPT